MIAGAQGHMTTIPAMWDPRLDPGPAKNSGTTGEMRLRYADYLIVWFSGRLPGF